MNGKTTSLFYLILLFLATPVVQAQTQKIPLSNVISSLEDEFKYQFNYFEDIVDGINIVPPPNNLTISETLEYLSGTTGLIFKKIDATFISVKKKSERILCGYLKDINTHEPIAGATIQGVKESSISGVDGYFELDLNSVEQEITIRYLGYKTIRRTSSFFPAKACQPIYLLQKQETLQQVVLSNYIVEGMTQLSTGELEIDFEKFNILPGLIETDVLQSVQAFPGIQSSNETVSNINIRGGSHDQNLILWDDIKMYQSGHFFGLISVFNPQITQKVSLKKSGTSSDYSDGVSGTIAMATKESVNQKFEGSVGATLLDLNAFVDVPVGKNSSFQIAGRTSLSDLVITPTYEQYFERISQDSELENNTEAVVNSDQRFKFYDTSLRWISEISDKDRLQINFINIANELVFNENATIDGEESSRESSVTQNSIAGGIQYQRTWNEDWISSLQIYETDYKLKAINANLFESQRFLQENVVSETGARLKNTYKINLQWLTHFGYQFLETEITNLDDVDVPLVRTLISEVVRTHSAFGQVDYQTLDKKTTVHVGLRYNYIDKFQKSLLEPRISMSQKLGSHFSLILTGELKHQVTSQIINFQNDFLGIEKRRWQLSNDDTIPVIMGQQASLALNYSHDGWLIGVEGYLKHVEGITTQSQGFQNQYEFEKEAGLYDVIGVDFLIRKRLKNTNLWMSYSYMNNDYQFENLEEQQFPSNLDITQALTLGATYRYRKLKISTGLNWRSGKPTTRPVEGNEIIDGEINYEPTNSSRLEDYLRVDSSALYELHFNKFRAHLGISVWNILDQQNELENYYRINTNGTIEEFVQKSLGLTPHALLRVYF